MAKLTRPFVCLPWGMDARAYRRRFDEGREPDESPYGFHLARQLGYDVTFSEDVPRVRKSRAGALLERLLVFDAIHVFRNRARIGRADVVWTMQEGEGLAVALLMRLRLVPQRPLIANAVWMFDRWERMQPVRRRFYRWLAGRITRLTVHSDGCLPICRQVLPATRSERMYFGINLATFALAPPTLDERAGRLRIAAIGSDDTRDWQTFLDAFGNDERFTLVLICQWVRAADVARYANCTLVAKPSAADFKRVYAEADFVAIPMRHNIYSGITVALEATAVGKPLLCSRTGGVPTYFDETEACYVPPGDAAALRDAALSLSASERQAMVVRAQARFRRDDYSTLGLIGRYAAITKQIEAEVTD